MPANPAKKRSRLENLRALEVSCVKEGAVERKFALIKNKDGVVPSADKAYIPPALTEAQSQAIEAYVALRNSQIQKDAEGDSEQLGAKEQAVLQAVFRMVEPLAGTLNIDDLVAMGAQAGLLGTEDAEDDDADTTGGDAYATEPVLQTEDRMDKVDKDANWQVPKPEGVSDDDHKAGQKAAKDAYFKAMGKTEKSAEDDEEEEEGMEKSTDKKDEAVAKSAELPAEMPAEQRAYFEQVQKRHQALLTKCATLEGQIETMRSTEILKSYESQLATELPQLSIDRKKTAQVLKTLKESNQEAHDAYLASLKAAHEQVAVSKSYGQGGLFGSSRQHSAPVNVAAQGGSPQQRMDAMLSEHISKSGNTDRHQAWSSLIQNPEFARLYEEGSMEGGV